MSRLLSPGLRQARAKDQAFAAAELPLVRVKARAAYATDELRAQIEPHLTTQPAPPVATPLRDEAARTPTCPKCGVPMVHRQASRGANVGEKFWGCPNYPRCR